MSDEKQRVLVVDDIESNRFILRTMVSEMGHVPILAENGSQAVRIVERMKPSLVLLDISMPEMDGYEVCSILKGNVETRDIPIIFISGYDDVEDIEKGFMVGGDDYITKPLIPAIVKSRIKVQLRAYAKTMDLEAANRKLSVTLSAQTNQLEAEKKAVLSSLAKIARANSQYDDEYLERVSHNCRTLATALQLSQEYEGVISDTFVDTLAMASTLCDIGNVAIPKDILAKKGPLTAEEFEQMKQHCHIGETMLIDMNTTADYNDFLTMASEIAGNHHENFDGSGYPRGRKGSEIPLSAQIVSVVMVYCALTEDRSFRDAYSSDVAFDIMDKEADIRYNKPIYEALKKISRLLR